MRTNSVSILVICILIFSSAVITTANGVQRITKEELKSKMERGEDILVLDVRTGSSYIGSKIKIKGSMRMAPDAIDIWSKNLPKNKEIITYCT